MQVKQKLLGDVTVLELTGKLDFGQGDEELSAAIAQLRKSGGVKLVLDLRGVAHIDTTCLGLLVTAYVRLSKQGGSLKLVRTPTRIREILTIAKLDEVLVTYDSEEEAVRSFARAAGV